MNSQYRLVIVWLSLLMLLFCFLMFRNTNQLEIQNEQGEEADDDRIRAEYQRVLLGCQTSGAIDSDDPWLRELCDIYLPELRNEMLAQ